MDTRRSLRPTLASALLVMAVFVLLYLSRLASYLLFHSVAELFAIVISTCVFLILWNSRESIDNDYLIFLGVASLAIAAIDTGHLLTYKGMGVFPNVPADVATQLWIAGRALQAFGLLLAPAFLTRRLDIQLLVTGWTMAVALTFAAIFWWRIFPSCLGDAGLTVFKLASEYVISVMFILALASVRRRADRFQPRVLSLLSWSIATTVLSELCFTLYSSPFSTFNLIGHFLRIIAVYLLYKAIIETALTEPHAVVFRELAETNRALMESEARIRREAELSHALNIIDAATNATLELDEILHRALLGAAQAVHADTAVISLREGADWRVTHTYNLPDDFRGTLLGLESGRHLFVAAECRCPILVRDALSDVRVDNGLAMRLGIRGLLTAPLAAAGQVFGILTFHIRDADREFRDSDRDFASRLAISLGLTFENARLYAAQREIAETLQGAMLSFPDTLPGVALGHAYRSADELAMTGGDFYDAFELEGGRIALVLGDVSGKGIAAATASSVVRTTLHAFSVPGATPSQVLSSANEALCRLLTDGVFATATYAILTTATGVLDLCSAGHPDPFVCTPTGCVTHDARRNRPLGIWPDTTFEQFQITLQTGDAIVLFSDGLPDARRGREFYGEERVHAVLDALRDEDPQSIADTLMADVVEFAAGQHTDDIAIVAASLGDRRSS